jgi:Ubiquitin carboxyl-terminal hydrolase
MPTILLPPPQPQLSPPSRLPAIKGIRRRDSAVDGGRLIEDVLVNGHPGGRPNTSTAVSGPPIPVTPPTLFSALRSLFLHIALHPADKGTVSPSSFISKVKEENVLYRSSMHQDAHEFLGFLLNKIVEDLEADIKKNAEMAGDDSACMYCYCYYHLIQLRISVHFSRLNPFRLHFDHFPFAIQFI